MPLQEEVIEASKLANAHGFIMALPDGYDTKVSITSMQLCCHICTHPSCAVMAMVPAEAGLMNGDKWS